jgi:hypothetical protein
MLIIDFYLANDIEVNCEMAYFLTWDIFACDAALKLGCMSGNAPKLPTMRDGPLDE